MNQFNCQYQCANGNGFPVSLMNANAGSTKAFSYRSLSINGIPSVSIEYHYGKPDSGSINRAERVVESYQKSNGAYYCIFDDGVAQQLDMLSLNTILHMKNIDVLAYEQNSKKYITIEGSYENKFVKFAVFDKGLIETAVMSTHARQKFNKSKPDGFLLDLFGIQP